MDSRKKLHHASWFDKRHDPPGGREGGWDNDKNSGGTGGAVPEAPAPTTTSGSGQKSGGVGAAAASRGDRTAGASASIPFDPQATLSPDGSGGPGTGNPGSGGNGDTGPGASGAGSSASKSGLAPGATAGIVLGLLALLALLALLLYKFRKTPFVQRLMSPFTKLGGTAAAGATPPNDGMGNTLLAAGAAGAGAAALAATRNDAPSPQPPMTEKPTASNAAAPHQRIMTPSPSDQMFAVSPTSPLSSGAYLAPPMPMAAVAAGTAVYDANKPLPPPPTRASAMTSLSRASSMSMGSTVMSPSNMSWPMPPITPMTAVTSPRTPAPPTSHGRDPSLEPSQWVSMQQPGETVVRINRH